MAVKELQTPLICKNEQHLEKDTRIIPRITYKNTTVILAVICSALTVWILSNVGIILWQNTLQKIVIITFFISAITISICWLCNKLVRIGRKNSLSQTVKSNDREKTH